MTRRAHVRRSQLSDTTTTAIISAATAVLGVGASYFGLQWRIRKDLEAKYDASLRDLRLASYKRLWSHLKPLALFARSGYPTRSDLLAFAESLRDWYFDEGGLYMSKKARDAYFRLQRALRRLQASDRWESEPTSTLDKDSFEHLRRIGSRLRTLLTLDVGTRNPFTFDAKAETADAAGPSRDESHDRDEGWIIRAWPVPAQPKG